MVNSHQKYFCGVSVIKMSLQQFFQTGSAFTLAIATSVCPLAVTQALFTPLAQGAASPDTTQITQAPAPASPPMAPATDPASSPRADTPGLFERSEYINACRRTNRSVEVFADTALSPVNRVGTLEANAQITLTGVLAPGRAQIIRRNSPDGNIAVVGWVNSAYLTTCGTPPTAKACYQVNVPALTLRSGPSSTSSYQGTISAGSIVYATTAPPTEQTSPNTPPDNGRIWVQVYVRNNPVWIARTGPLGVGNNATRLSDAECNR